jgi:hypothetical protein
MMTTIDAVPAVVRDLFERNALLISDRGFQRYSADAILHSIRWHMHVERGNREFKLNNNWTAPLARWFMKRHPELPQGFFETRVRKSRERWMEE